MTDPIHDHPGRAVTAQAARVNAMQLGGHLGLTRRPLRRSQCVERNRFPGRTKSPETKLPTGIAAPERSAKMRSLMFGACLLAVAFAGFHSMISSALTAARDARAATFSERFAPALKTPS